MVNQQKKEKEVKKKPKFTVNCKLSRCPHQIGKNEKVKKHQVWAKIWEDTKQSSCTADGKE